MFSVRRRKLNMSGQGEVKYVLSNVLPQKPLTAIIILVMVQDI